MSQSRATETAMSVTRRRVLKGAGGLVAAALPASAAARGAEQSDSKTAGAVETRSTADVTGRLARYMVAARDRDLPAPIVRDGKNRILDTIGAMISGAVLPPGVMATRYIRAQGGTAEASVLTTDIRTTAVNAALANGMFAHADETDDFEPVTKAHPGWAVVPAALAMAEREGRSGTELIRAVVLGYDVCCRFLMTLGPITCAPPIAARKVPARRSVQSAQRLHLRVSTRRACDSRCRTPRSRCPASVELDARRRPRREGVRLCRHGRAQRRHRGDDGRRPGSPAYPMCSTASTT